MAHDELEVDVHDTHHHVREHGVCRHEQRPEHDDERRGDHQAARDGRGTVSSVAPPVSLRWGESVASATARAEAVHACNAPSPSAPAY